MPTLSFRRILDIGLSPFRAAGDPQGRAREAALGVVLGYLITSGLWILLTDLLVSRTLRTGSSAALVASVIKGFGFVALTAGLLHRWLMWLLLRLERARQDLIDANALFRRTILDAPNPSVVHAEDGEILLLNRAWEEITGYSSDELGTVGDWTERAYGERREDVERGIRRLYDLEARVDEPDFEIRTKGGETRIWSFSTAPLGRLPDGRRTVLSMARDVTDRRRVEDALRESESRFRTLAEAAPESIFIQCGGRFAYVNPATARLMGEGGVAALLGTPVIDRFHVEDRPKVVERIRVLNEERRVVGVAEERVLRGDGTAVPVEVCAVPIRHGDRDAALVFMHDVTQIKANERALIAARDRHRALSRQLLSVQEVERGHLARELHDEIGQCLTAIKLDVENALARPEAAPERLADADQLLARTLTQVRSMALDLRPSMLDDLGLVPALRWYVDRFQERSGVRARLRVVPDAMEVDSQTATACFRVAQEALTNVARHARAASVRVELERRDDEIGLTIRDDGKGFEVSGSSYASGFGLSSMRERVEYLGGSFEIRSGRDAGGVEVRARFPARRRPIEAPT